MSESQQVQCGIATPGLYPAFYVYAQYSNTTPAISYSEYVQLNN